MKRYTVGTPEGLSHSEAMPTRAASPRHVGVNLALGSLLAVGTALVLALFPGRAGTTCQNPGWFPTGFGLKDHTIFRYQGFYYLASIHLFPDDRFAYARSVDLCTWEELPPILGQRVPGSADEKAIWAPYVYEEKGVYYLYYTGVTTDFTQSIMLATSSDPADPNSWQPQGVVFQPGHPGMVWQSGSWADCRDPMVIRDNGGYYLYYAGTDTSGGIIGVATAAAPGGPWQDQGATVPPDPAHTPESPTVARFGGLYYLFVNLGYVGEEYRVASSPTGPWGPARGLQPGWAHEVWQDPSGDWYTSYLTDPTVTISPLSWDTFVRPATPFIGPVVHHVSLPMVRR